MKLHTDLKMCLNEKCNSTTWGTKVLNSVLETAFFVNVSC